MQFKYFLLNEQSDQVWYLIVSVPDLCHFSYLSLFVISSLLSVGVDCSLFAISSPSSVGAD